MSGWVKQDRAVFKDTLLDDGAPYSPREAWLWLIGKAAYSDGEHELYGHRVHLNKGELLISQRDLASAWRWSRGKVERFLAKLEKAGRMIKASHLPSHLPSHLASHLTICDSLNFPKERATKRATPRATPRATQEEYRNNNTPSGGNARAREARRFHPSALPDDWREWAAGQGMDGAAILKAWDRFDRHHRSEGRKKVDWRPVWEAWIVRDIEEGRTTGPKPSVVTGDALTPSQHLGPLDKLKDYFDEEQGQWRSAFARDYWRNQCAGDGVKFTDPARYEELMKAPIKPKTGTGSGS